MVEPFEQTVKRVEAYHQSYCRAHNQVDDVEMSRNRHHRSAAQGRAEPRLFLLCCERSMSGDVPEVSKQRLEVHSLLPHLVIAVEEPDALVYENAGKDSKHLQKGHH